MSALDFDAQAVAAQRAGLVALAAEEIDHGVVITDPLGRIVYLNRAFCSMFDYSEADLLGHPATKLLGRGGFDAGMVDSIRSEVASRRSFEAELPVTPKDGDTLWMSTIVKPLFGETGEIAHYLLVFSDINESKQIQRLQRDALAAIASDRPLRDIMRLICERVEEMAPDVVCSILAVDETRRLRPLAAPSLPEAFGRAIDGLLIGPTEGSCGTAAFHGRPVLSDDIATDPLWDKYKGLPLPLGLLACWSSPIVMRNGRVGGTFAFYYRQKRGPSSWHQHIVRACLDLCLVALERAEAQERITRLAYYDPLTGLPNRSLLREEMERLFDPKAETQDLSVLFVDVDRFKDVNDTLGHAVGDKFLREIAARIRTSVWPEDIVARHGGDEFVVVLVGADAPRAKAVAEFFLEKLAEPVIVDGTSLPASVSIGISVCPADGCDSVTLMRNADTAMYRAKGEGRNTYRFFAPEMNQTAQDRIALGAALRDAIGNGQLHFAYQPQIDACTGSLFGVEALARWTHPHLGEISPARFIPLAEDSGLIEAIGECCLDQACRQLHDWDKAGLTVPHVAVNISPTQFRSPRLIGAVRSALSRSGLAPGRLTVEVTESVMMDAYPAALANAATLREMGVTISMDDFGTGYSSLSHLARLPVTEIKIDRSFVATLEESPATQALVTAVIRIGESLKLRVVAEGVETDAQRRFLETLGCDVLQGYLFGRAMSPAALMGWLRDRDTPVPRQVAGAA